MLFRSHLPEGPREELFKAPSEAPKADLFSQQAEKEEEPAAPLLSALPEVAPEKEDAPEAPKMTLESAALEVHTEKGPETAPLTESRSSEVPEAPVKMPEGLNLEIRDAQGRWELGVVREQNTVHLEFQGDPELRRIVMESTREVGERLAKHGDSLGSVSWRPMATPSSSSSQDRPNDSSHQQASQQQQQNQQQQGSFRGQTTNASEPEKVRGSGAGSSSPPPKTTSSQENQRRSLRVI